MGITCGGTLARGSGAGPCREPACGRSCADWGWHEQTPGQFCSRFGLPSSVEGVKPTRGQVKHAIVVLVVLFCFWILVLHVCRDSQKCILWFVKDWAVTLIPMPMPNRVCRAVFSEQMGTVWSLYNCLGRGMGMNITAREDFFHCFPRSAVFWGAPLGSLCACSQFQEATCAEHVMTQRRLKKGRVSRAKRPRVTTELFCYDSTYYYYHHHHYYASLVSLYHYYYHHYYYSLIWCSLLLLWLLLSNRPVRRNARAVFSSRPAAPRPPACAVRAPRFFWVTVSLWLAPSACALVFRLLLTTNHSMVGGMVVSN